MRNQKSVLEDLIYLRESARPICIFGAGKIGCGHGYEIVKMLNLKVDCYFDNDLHKWGCEIVDGIRCEPISGLKKEYAYLLMGGNHFADEVKEQLAEIGAKVFITYFELCALDIVIESFFKGDIYFHSDIEKKKEKVINADMRDYPHIPNKSKKDIAVYTCITGDYDFFKEAENISDRCDYYLISEKKPDDLKFYQWINIYDICPGYVTDNVRQNRFCKINGDILFEEYQYSIYLDGSILPANDISNYVYKVGKSGIGCHKHPVHQCLYAEGMWCIRGRKDDEFIIRNQMCKYRQEGMPREYGEFECGMLVRENKNILCKTIMHDWWREVYVHSYRDQLSFTYSLWKNGIESSKIGNLGADIRENSDVIFVKKHRALS